MTRDGKENRFAWLTLDDAQAERIAVGDVAAVGEFIEQNRKKLTGMARRVLRNYPNVIPANEYEVDDCINQICVDFPYYDFTDGRTLAFSIFRSFIGIAHGGYRKNLFGRANFRTLSLDKPASVSQRSGDTEDGETLGERMQSNEPTPYEIVAEREHVEEIAPRFYYEIKRLFGGDDEKSDGATVGEILAAREGEKPPYDPFCDVIEEIFKGYLFEQVRAMARREA